MKIGLVSCSAKKKSGTLPAVYMYDSPLFKKSMKYSYQNYDKVFILSAKYGLLDPSQPIQNYDLTLNNFSKKEKAEWGNKVAEKIAQLEGELYFLTGENYYSSILPYIENTCHFPLKGMGIGQRLRYLTEELK